MFHYQANSRGAQLIEGGGTARLNLSMAVADCDHVRDLVSGEVTADGVVLTPMTLPVEEIFFRFLKNREFDVAELSFAKFLTLQASGETDFVGLPVFPSRVFRHSAIYVRQDSGISDPKDLEGKTVGIPEWAQTAGVYVRGILKESYGIDLAKVKWVQAGVNQPGRVEKVKFSLPEGVQYESRPEKSLNEMLVSGEIDVAITARPPQSLFDADSPIKRLFDNPRHEEFKNFQETGLFPIMHVVVMRRPVFESHPWVGRSLYKAFDEAKKRSLERMVDITSARVPLPWAASQAEELIELFGNDPWPYGIAENDSTLSTFCRFIYEQGLSDRLVKPVELFPKELHESVRV